MIESGFVIAVEDNSIWVETEQKSSCGGCAARSGCGQSLLSKMHPERKNTLQLPLILSSAVPAVGDRVEFSVPDHAVIKGASLVYLLPLLGMLFAAIAGAQLSSNEFLVISASALGFYLGFKVAAHIGRGHYQEQLQPTLLPPNSSQSSSRDVAIQSLSI